MSISKNSALVEALHVTGSLQRGDIDERLQELEFSVSRTRGALNEALSSEFVEFLPNTISKGRRLLSTIHTSVDALDADCERISKELKSYSRVSEVERESVRKRLTDVENQLRAVTQIAEFATLLDEVDAEAEGGDLFTTVKNVLLLQTKLEDRATQAFFSGSDHRLLAALKREVTIHREKLVYELHERWRNTFSWDMTSSDTKHLSLSIKLADDAIATGGKGKCVLSSMCNSLALLGEFETKVSALADALFMRICTVIVRHEGTLVISSTGGATTLGIYADEKEQQPWVVVALEQLCNLVETLSGVLSVDVVAGQAQLTLMSAVVDRLCVRLCALVDEELVKPSVPTQQNSADDEEMRVFELVLNGVGRLREALLRTGCPTAEGTPLLDYGENVETLLSNRRCQQVLSRSRDLIKRGLHAETVSVGGDDDAATSTSTSTPLVSFPKCRISTAVVELHDLVTTTLKGAFEAKTSPTVARRLVETARNVFEIFADIALPCHRDEILMLPIAAAIFYNNSMYLAHKMLQIDTEYGSSSSATRRLFAAASFECPPISFIDYVPRLRQLGIDALEMQLRVQQRQLDDCLHETNGFSSISNDENYRKCDKALKQCVLELQRVHRVWKEVLPLTIFMRIEAKLAQHLFNFIFNSISKMEDISTTDSNVMQTLLKELLERVEKLFVVEKASEISRYCDDSYMRFRELLFVLSANLQSIADRWAHGKGPLAAYLSPDEVKGLLRALFQNTERRAAVLAQIK